MSPNDDDEVKNDDELIVVVHETSVLVVEDLEDRQDRGDGGERLSLPARALVAPLTMTAETTFLGRLAGRDCFGALADAALRAAPPPGMRFAPVRTLFAVLPEATLEIVGRAIAAIEFETMHRHCGRCGGPTQPVTGERARACAACGATFHPRIPPAAIVLVTRDDGRILLARNARFPPGMFSAVAGFVEMGESLEQAARREVAEEVGVKIDGLRYFGSQPWPFGRSLMVGFFARYAGGEIAVDGAEIAEARWFARDRLPLLPPPISIARKLIDAWLGAAVPGADGGAD